jgi:hypothetical protein
MVLESWTGEESREEDRSAVESRRRELRRGEQRTGKLRR